MSTRNASNPRIHRPALPACLWVLVSVGLAAAQPTYVSGVAHTAMGGATLGPATDRRLPVHNLGSSGQDGVEISLNTAGGLSCDVDLHEVTSTPGSHCSAAFKGWDGNIKGRMYIYGGGGVVGGDGCTLACDYGSYETTLSVTVTLRDNIGTVLASVDVPGGSASCVVALPDTGGGTLPPRDWTITALKSGWNLISNPYPYVVSGLTVDPIPNVSTVEFMRIVCITAPCPGDWSNLSSMQITGSGTPSGSLTVAKVNVQDLSCCFSSHPSSPPKSHHAMVHGTGQVHLEEYCDLPPPSGCAPTERKLEVSNIGSSGQDGVSIDLRSAYSIDTSNIVHRDLAARSLSVTVTGTPGGTPGGGGGTVMSCAYKRHELGGNVTLIKLVVNPDPLTGEVTYGCDATARGAPTCQVQCLGITGAVLATATVSSTDVVTSTSCAGGDISYIGTCDASGRCVIDLRTCQMPWRTCRLPSGATVAEVATLVYRPINPTKPAGVIETCSVTATDLASMSIDDISYEPPEHFGGRAHGAVGAAVLAAIDEESVAVSNIGSSGNDGVEVHLDAHGGGACVDLNPLLGSSASDRSIRIRHKGWDGVIYGHVVLSRPSGLPGDTITETYDLSSTGVAGMTWKLFNAQGVPLRQGHSVGPVLSYTITPEGTAGATFDKCYSVVSSGTASVARDAQQGFFDRVVTVDGLPPGTPVLGVASIQITPDPCAGLPENCPPYWSNLSSVVITAAGIPQCDVSQAHLSTVYQPAGTRGLRVSGLHNAVCEDIRESPTLQSTGKTSVRNIGSSGQDGVSIELGTIRTGTQVAVRSSSTGAGGGSGGSATSFRSKRCPDCPPGHITLIKLHDEGPATGARLVGVDSSGRGSTETLVECRASSVLLGSAVMTAYQRVILFVVAADNYPEMTCYADGTGDISYVGPCDAILPNGTFCPGVTSLRVTPINPTVPVRPCDTIDITGTNLDEMLIQSLTVTPPCRADINGDGVINPSDVAAFISLWVGSLQQGTLAGDFDGNGVVNPADVGAFVSAWFTALTTGQC